MIKLILSMTTHVNIASTCLLLWPESIFCLCYLFTAFILPVWWLMSICLLCVQKKFLNFWKHEIPWI